MLDCFVFLLNYDDFHCWCTLVLSRISQYVLKPCPETQETAEWNVEQYLFGN